MDEKRHGESQNMTPVTDVEIAREWADILEEREARRTGLTLREVRSIVARRTGVPEGKLYSLRRGRLKDIANRWLTKLGEGVIEALQSELRHVEHELQTLRQIGVHPDSDEMRSVLASREKVRAALNLPAALNGGGDV
jgi:DNA-binding transcriptional MerR regulator